MQAAVFVSVKSIMNTKEYKHGFKNGIPIFLGYLAVSFTFGVSAKSAGLTVFQATLMSALNFTSAGQFAALGVISAGASLAELALTQLVINLRYCLMSSALTQHFSPDMRFFNRFLFSFGNTDEVFGVCASYPKKLTASYCYGVLSSALPGWVLGTLFGALSGTFLPQRILSALGIALYGMFIAIIIPPAKKNYKIAGIIAVSMALSALFYYLPPLNGISSGFRIIILTVAVSAVAAVIFPVKEGA